MSMKSWQLSRRAFLRGTGVSLALPLLNAMQPVLRAAETGAAARSPMRLVCVGNPYGMIPERFFPHETGADFELPPLLEPLGRHRGEFTVFSNLDHGVSGGHRVVDTFLTGVKTSDASTMPEGNVSLDQKAAEFVGAQTRFPSLNLGVGGACEMCWTRTGVNVPVITSSREIFRALFVDDRAEMRKQISERNGRRSSVLDAVNEQAQSLNRRLGKEDQSKLQEYLNSVREVESRLRMSEHWLDHPKPKVDMAEPTDGGFVESLATFYDLMLLALQTDSSRVVTLEMPINFNTTDLGLTNSYHAYSHHGKAEENLAGLTVIERFQMEQFSRFLDGLKLIQESEGSLLDRTMVLFGSGMGNGSSHSNRDLPILLAGGPFRHAGHVRLPDEPSKRVSLCNLYVSMLQQFGLETDRFGTSTGTLSDFRSA